MLVTPGTEKSQAGRSAATPRDGSSAKNGNTHPPMQASTWQRMPRSAAAAAIGPTGSTSLAKLREVSGVEVVTAANHTGCLVLFQQGRADAITGDDTVLAGLAAQDPYAKVTDAEAITDEPYGLGIAKDNVYFVRYVNAVLERLRADGGWAKIYNRWLAESLGPAPEPPAPVYGRR